MTSLERIGAALSGKFADRRAVAPLLALYGSRLAGIPLERYYRDAAAYTEGQQAVVRRFDPDALFGPFVLAYEAAAYGAELKWTETAPPNVRKHLRLSAGALPSIIAPENDADLSYLVESVRLTAEFCRGEKPVAAVLTSPADLPALLLGVDAWLEILLFDPAAASDFLSFSEEHFVALASAYFKAGATFIAVPIMFANPAILTDALIEKLALPALRRAFARASGPIVFHHGAIPLAERIGMFKDLPNVAGFLLDEKDDSTTARNTLGPGPLLIAGPAGPTLRNRSPESVAATVRRFLRERADDPAFMIATGAADIPVDTDPEIIDALLRAARNEEPIDG
ncbi:MAG: uroporphyrinogen decarboxylase family protein [Treponemataceae bacterium]